MIIVLIDEEGFFFFFQSFPVSIEFALASDKVGEILRYTSF